MPDDPTCLIYGANGYTGRLIAAEAAARGMRPIVAGRNAKRVNNVARELNCASRVFALRSPAAIVPHLRGVAAVLNCAGPFSSTAMPMIEACLQAGAHYLDLTGEIDCLEAAAALDERARRAGVLLLPAVGFDVVPSDCLAAMLAARLPGATQLELALWSQEPMSPGTFRTVLENIGYGGRVRRDGEIRRVPFAWKVRDVEFAGLKLKHGPAKAMTIPWGDVSSAWYSTGIPNITVYGASSPALIGWLRRFRGLLPVVRPAVMQRALGLLMRPMSRGPSAEQRVRCRAFIWGRVESADGTAIEATLETPGGYAFTVITAIAALEQLPQVSAASGFKTPSQAFGAEFVLGLPRVKLRGELADPCDALAGN